VKTTVDIADDLLERARQYARRTGQSVRAVIEDGLRLALRAERAPSRYRVADRSVGNPRDPNPLEALSWQDQRDEIYQDRRRC
jgi:hypothetical protein